MKITLVYPKIRYKGLFSTLNLLGDYFVITKISLYPDSLYRGLSVPQSPNFTTSPTKGDLCQHTTLEEWCLTGATVQTPFYSNSLV